MSSAINLLRTRLQASGSPGHPTVYTGFLDVANQTLAREGWQGLYKGLVPTLAKVVPAVSISYVVSRRWMVDGGWWTSLTAALHRFTSTASGPYTLLDSIESYNEPAVHPSACCTNDDTRTDYKRIFSTYIPLVCLAFQSRRSCEMKDKRYMAHRKSAPRVPSFRICC